MEKRKIDYKALYASGEIRSIFELFSILSNELIETYARDSPWPDYKPTPAERRDFGRIFLLLGMDGKVPFSAFVQMMKEGSE
jgi:hypothetical protein